MHRVCVITAPVFSVAAGYGVIVEVNTKTHKILLIELLLPEAQMV